MRNFWKYIEVIVKIGKANTVTNIRGKTKTKTDKDKKVENKRITVKCNV